MDYQRKSPRRGMLSLIRDVVATLQEPFMSSDLLLALEGKFDAKDCSNYMAILLRRNEVEMVSRKESLPGKPGAYRRTLDFGTKALPPTTVLSELPPAVETPAGVLMLQDIFLSKRAAYK